MLCDISTYPPLDCLCCRGFRCPTAFGSDVKSRVSASFGPFSSATGFSGSTYVIGSLRCLFGLVTQERLRNDESQMVF